jgi:membrane protease YdiL (CAAX protease family)
MLFSRIVLFAAWQALIAIAYHLSGQANAWTRSAAWWPVTATLTNVVCIFLLIRLHKQEGLNYWDLFRFGRDTVKSDAPVAFGLALIGIVVATIPNVMLGMWLFGNAEASQALIFRPLPLWAIYPALICFPVTIALAELPTYFAYVMPRLRQQLGDWPSMLVSSLVLAFQHVTLPLVFDLHFLLWRLLMFIPLALMVGIVLRWRSRLLIYMVIIHGLMDFYAAWLILAASR